MRVLEIRPARMEARYVEIGDMLVASPIGADGPRPPRWLGKVTEHIIVNEIEEPETMRRWRLELVDGQFTETAAVPADGMIWLHVPSSALPS